MYILWLRC